MNKKTSFAKVNTIVSVGLCLLTLTILPFVNLWQISAAGTITGRVFQDYNANGTYETAATAAIDSGVAAVSVTAYDAGGVLRGTATTAADGTYSLTATGTGPYRVEFTTLPTGFQPSAHSTNSVTGRTATTAGSSVQFVPDGTTANVNLAINRPVDYCQNNPTICVPQNILGNVDGNSLRSFPYNYSGDTDGNITTTTTAAPSRDATLAPTNIGVNNSIGTLFGVAYDGATKNLYASAYVKRDAKLGALSGESTGAIYVKNTPTAATPAATLFVNLNTIFTATTAGANPHPAATTTWTGTTPDTATTAVVGKVGLGGLKMSQDGATLYAVNLADRQLYLIPTTGTLSSTTITRFPIPTTGLTTPSGTNCAAADVRPFGLGRDGNGQIYVGAVCSGETAANNNQLQAYVWRFAAGGTFTLVATNALNFARAASPTESAAWSYWSNTPTNILNRAAPMLTDIDFDRGNMIVGFRDRYGDQTDQNGAPNANRGYGDVMRACASGALFNFEINGSCGGVTTTGAGTNAGNGGGEYYVDFNGDGREEGAMGGLLQLAGYNHTLVTSYDAVAVNSAGTRINNFYTSGVQRYNNTTGLMSGAYDIYLQADTNIFGKANGLGDVEALCDKAPIEIGNRVWRDTNGNGVQDANELGIAGVTVHLYNAANQIVATAVTDANGEYFFSSAPGTSTANTIYNLALLPNTGYSIRLDNPANYAAGGPLNGIFLTLSNQTSQAGFKDGTDSDAFLTANPVGSPAGNFPVITITTGAAGANDHTYDFGFSSAAPTAAAISVGGRVLDHSGRGIGGARLTLTLPTGAQRVVTTNSFGFFSFNEIEVGKNNLISVSAKRYSFAQPTLLVSATENVDNIYFIADGQ